MKMLFFILNIFSIFIYNLMKSQKNKRPFNLKTALISCAFISSSISLSNPLDLIRCRLQKVLSEPYKGIKDCFLKIKKEEGLRAFWKGNLSNVLRIIPSQSLIFYLKEFFHVKFHYGRKQFSQKEHFMLNGAIGMTSSLIVQFFLYPLQYVRQKLAIRTDDKGIGIWHQLKKTIKQDGIRRLYHGVTIFIMGSLLFRGTYFGLYDSLKVTTDDELLRFLYSYVSIFIAIMIPYPADTVRRRIIASKEKYSGFLDCSKRMIKTQGIKSIFLGWNMILLQSITSSLFFFTYDKLFTNYEQARI